ncbi:MAG: hypothetical protein EHM52_01590 [Actinomycetota bacterium]|nr:MAG: hypothetical protein EHM52_01590 [Actinomycetota bacterium]
MRSRFPLIIIAALAALAALAVGLVAVAGADDDTDLPPMTAAELLARVAAHEEGPPASAATSPGRTASSANSRPSPTTPLPT